MDPLSAEVSGNLTRILDSISIVSEDLFPDALHIENAQGVLPVKLR